MKERADPIGQHCSTEIDGSVSLCPGWKVNMKADKAIPLKKKFCLLTSRDKYYQPLPAAIIITLKKMAEKRT